MEEPEVSIEPGRQLGHYWRDLWRYRDLLGFLAWRDIKVRYQQAVLGVGWAIIQPALQTLLLTFVFSRIAGLSDSRVPYSLIVLSGLLPWQFFANAFSSAGNSLIGNGHLISKVYFPRMVIPLSSLAVACIDSLIVFVLTLLYAFFLGFWPGWQLLCLPVFLLPLLLLTLGCGLWTTVLTVKYRDFRFITPFAIQTGLFITPVAYKSQGLGPWQVLLEWNPMTGVVEGFRWCFLGGGFQPSLSSYLISLGAGLLVLFTGLLYFRRSERQLADII